MKNWIKMYQRHNNKPFEIGTTITIINIL